VSSQRADIIWQSGAVPVSTRFDDPYFSLHDGLAETRHVFLAGNDLPARFRDGFRIAELGFGTGLNVLAAARAWQEAGCAGGLHITSFEAFPLALADMDRVLDHRFPGDPLAAALTSLWAGGRVEGELAPGITLTIILGDARATLPAWTGCADAWFLDGFSPARNPELWETALMAEVARHTAPDGTFATYTAAGHVRRALASAGFAVERRPGYGRKRHMSAGRLAP